MFEKGRIESSLNTQLFKLDIERHNVKDKRNLNISKWLNDVICLL